MKKKIMPGKIIALGFLSIIAVGTILFMLPVSYKSGKAVSFIDALFTATSAVCVTGLSTFDPGSVFSGFGQTVLAVLIQLGGLGITCISLGLLMLTGQKVFIRQRTLAKEALNYNSLDGILTLVKSVLFTTVIIESLGAILNFTVFIQEYPLQKAIGLSLFHSVSSFNNAGFDVFGNGNSLVSYGTNTLFLLITSFLIISGGLGFIVIKEILVKHKFRKFSLHTKIVLSVTFLLLSVGTLILMLTDKFSLLEAFFMSTSTRTAGFTSVNMNDLSNGGLLTCIFLMFIGASPTSTGGGIKTTTFFVIITALYSYSTNKSPTAFKRKLPRDILYKSFIIFTLALLVVICSSLMLCILHPEINLRDIVFEVVSAFATVGLSTGITSSLSTFGKLVIIVTMFIGRLGPLTIASLWIFKRKSDISYAEESVPLG